MARRKKVVSYRRDIGVDERFQSPLIQKLINVVMWRGKKNVARAIVYDAIDILIKKSGNSEEKGLQLFQKGIDQIIPLIEVRPRRVGGSVYQIPMEVESNRALSLGMRWLIQAASARSDRSMDARTAMGVKLANELFEAGEGRGGAFKKKLDVHKMAEANRAFSHFAW
ncbi:MAG: 30S ribosomal protein S7 [Candidatus Babeliales bacterium]